MHGGGRRRHFVAIGDHHRRMTTTGHPRCARDGSNAEKICWKLRRDRRINGAKFRRQNPIGPYFANFACVSQKLSSRLTSMESLGWRVVRFWANEVVANPEGIRAEIEKVTKGSVTPSPRLSS